MKNIYICHTLYHLLVSIANINLSEENYLLISQDIKNRDYLLPRLKNKDFFKEIYLDNSINIYKYNNIYIYNDATPIGDKIRRKKLFYNLLEDSYDYYSYNTQYNGIKFYKKLYFKIFKNRTPFGYSKYCKNIYVNNVSIVPKDERYNKFIELNKDILFSKLSEIKLRYLYEIFINGKKNKLIKFSKRKKVIILTQPFYNDRIYGFYNQNIQLKYYKEIVDNYCLNYDVYLKVHPRDTIDYSLISNVILLDKDIPIEVYEIFYDVTFDIGITHSSTSLDYLKCVKEKIFLENLRE